MSQSLLQNVYLFKSMTEKELQTVGGICETQSFNTGDSIFLRGEPGKAMYLIKFGSIKIQQTTSTGDNLEVATLGTGSHFGEMPFIDAEVRSATAMASEACELIVVPFEKLEAILKADNIMASKFYRDLSRFLCGRLRATTTDLGFAREKNLGSLV